MSFDLITAFLALKESRISHVRLSILANQELRIDISGSIPHIGEEQWILREGQFDDPFFTFAIACAYCQGLSVESFHDGVRRVCSFSRGLIVERIAPEITSATERLSARLVADSQLFPQTATFSFLGFCYRIQALALFHPLIQFIVEDSRSGEHRDYRYPDGLMSLLPEVDVRGVHDENVRWLSPAIHLKLDADDEYAEAVVYGGSAAVFSYVNGAHLPEHGSHLRGLKRGFSDVLKRTDPAQFELSKDDVLEGATILIAMKLNAPHFYGATRDKLDDVHAEEMTYRMVLEQVAFDGGFRKRNQGR